MVTKTGAFVSSSGAPTEPSAKPPGRREFGERESVEVRVWDSTSECRYMVLPERPAGTEGMTEEELVSLITRDSLVGVTRIEAPAPVG